MTQEYNEYYAGYPGTTWDMRHKDGHSWCVNCGEGYNSHGAPEDVAGVFGIPVAQRHLICPRESVGRYVRRVDGVFDTKTLFLHLRNYALPDMKELVIWLNWREHGYPNKPMVELT